MSKTTLFLTITLVATTSLAKALPRIESVHPGVHIGEKVAPTEKVERRTLTSVERTLTRSDAPRAPLAPQGSLGGPTSELSIRSRLSPSQFLPGATLSSHTRSVAPLKPIAPGLPSKLLDSPLHPGGPTTKLSKLPLNPDAHLGSQPQRAEASQTTLGTPPKPASPTTERATEVHYLNTTFKGPYYGATPTKPPFNGKAPPGPKYDPIVVPGKQEAHWWWNPEMNKWFSSLYGATATKPPNNGKAPTKGMPTWVPILSNHTTWWWNAPGRWNLVRPAIK